MKRWLVIAAQAGLTLLLGWTLLNKIDLAGAIESASRLAPWAGVGLVALSSTQSAGIAWRTMLMVRSTGQRCSFSACLRAVLVGGFINQTPLTVIGGDAARLWYISREGVALRDAASAVAMDRVLGLVALLLLVSVTGPVLWSKTQDPLARIAIPLATLGAAGGVLALLLLRLTPRALLKFRIVRWVANLSTMLGRTIASGFGTRAIGLGTGCNLINVLVIHGLFAALGAPVSVLDCLILVPFPLLLSLLPISVGGWGVREGAMVVAFALVGVPTETTLAVSVLFGLILLAWSLPGGIILLRYPIAVSGRGRTGA